MDNDAAGQGPALSEVLGPMPGPALTHAGDCAERGHWYSEEQMLQYAGQAVARAVALMLSSPTDEAMSAVPPVLRSSLTLEHAEIEARCRKAFLLEDGYGVPSEHPELYRTFRDGFFAAWMRARSDLGA
jgi:hypothetical protein